ncbi:uncharacterized protein LAESUDRAFT_719469 [Laetiporus sulphureus 93-53]|uniref:Chromatin target of PRMT1 protein C-terminal domain-containing protein n=1 Tax=Laetiporus sulphureus 93-53 TaxID=1314785 RepID=A0A165IJ87_9APHY|nr:uncharacterized protein LAESUDRAFT_719469 [Laetiporus sulphureus 93-53]KZT13154.1 hypothetical protein LAESUDRAFT_719469 [Laetiporus sulphureus 93-53]
MENTLDISEPPQELLSYDETISYEEQLPTQVPIEPGRPQLADRIGNTKVYLLSETTGTRLGKRKHDEEAIEGNEEGDVEMEEDSLYRENAIFIRGTPVSHLPTPSIFAYATHFDAHPMALEWIDDTTCILVFNSKTAARDAFRHLTKSIAEEPSAEDGSITAKPIPVAIWPPEERINKSLGKGEGLKGTIRMRWATRQDVKKRGAKKESEFYRKYGSKAGKNAGEEGLGQEGEDGRQRKRRRGDEVDEAIQKSQLDEELDAFLNEDEEPQAPPSPPSKMRSDYLGTSGKSLLERTSVMRARPEALESRMMAEIPRRARSHRDNGLDDGRRRSGERYGRRDRGGARDRGRTGGERPRKTQQDLDDELDAFLRERD